MAGRWSTYKWEFTPPHHNSPPQQQVPSKDPHFQAVMPPSPLALEQPPPPEPSRRRRSARLSVRGGFHFSTPEHSSNYPPIFEDPQMGRPSNAVFEVDYAPVAPAPPPMGYENPIPAYPDAAGHNSFEPQDYSGYNYNAPLSTHTWRQQTLMLFTPRPFHPRTQLGSLHIGINTHHLHNLSSSSHLNLKFNHHSNKKFFKGCMRWNKGWKKGIDLIKAFLKDWQISSREKRRKTVEDPYFIGFFSIKSLHGHFI
ncbi:hypothetical protein Hanom_Chr14g01292281 [Helianthus anomalus]